MSHVVQCVLLFSSFRVLLFSGDDPFTFESQPLELPEVKKRKNEDEDVERETKRQHVESEQPEQDPQQSENVMDLGPQTMVDDDSSVLYTGLRRAEHSSVTPGSEGRPKVSGRILETSNTILYISWDKIK